MQPVDASYPYYQEVEIAEKAVREAGSIIMRWYGSDYRVEEKSKGNPVTTADLEANAAIRKTIRERFPDDGWLSEEDKDNSTRLRSSRVWVVDPIDGTKEFIEGVPQFAVSVGFVVDGVPALGIVYNPAQGEFYRAVRGRGALLNDRPIHVSSRKEVDGALLTVSRSEPKHKFQLFADRCRLDPIGSIAYRLAKVAGGDGDATLTFRSMHEWDICAGVLLVEEAGGVVVDGTGKRLVFNQRQPRFRGVVASNETLTPTLQGLLARILFGT
jgi:myo-inositol-1(or 4)-monophosphatase